MIAASLCGCSDDPHRVATSLGEPTDRTSSSPTHEPGFGDEPTSSGTTQPTTPTTTAETSSSSSSGSSTNTGSDTDVPSDSCGNGIVDFDLGETCDDSYLWNSDNGACTQSCQDAFCGDGLLWTGMETCDHGSANNDQTYGGCTENCVPGPRCGDGVLQVDAGEECDPDGSPLPDGNAACTPGTCRLAARLAFVTAAKFNGALGGLDAADQRCAEAATSAGLDNAQRFKAWLSDGVATPAMRLTTAIADTGYPYATVGGLLIADDLTDLIAHGPNIPIDITETGAKLPPEQIVWTNIGAYGQASSPVSHCKKWTDASFQLDAWAGQISPKLESDLPTWKSEDLWTAAAARPCAYIANLYCLED